MLLKQWVVLFCYYAENIQKQPALDCRLLGLLVLQIPEDTKSNRIGPRVCRYNGANRVRWQVF